MTGNMALLFISYKLGNDTFKNERLLSLWNTLCTEKISFYRFMYAYDSLSVSSMEKRTGKKKKRN